MCNEGKALILDCMDILGFGHILLRIMSGRKIAEEDDINKIGENKESKT